MTIRNRLKLIGLVPITLLILLSSYFFVTSYVNYEKANALKTTLINNGALDKALMNIGKERGLTALYLGSDKKEYADVLRKQRNALDESFENLKYEVITENKVYLPFLLEIVEGSATSAFDPYKRLIANIGKLPEARKKIDTEDVEFKNIIFRTYTDGLSIPTLDKILTLKNYALDTEISSLIGTLTQLYTAKENTGLERGFISYYMAKKSSLTFEEIALWDKFKTKANIFDIKQVTNPVLRQQLEKVLHNDNASEIMNELGMTSAAIQTDIDNGDYAEEVMDWFALMTQKISLLSKAELVVSNALWTYFLLLRQLSGY